MTETIKLSLVVALLLASFEASSSVPLTNNTTIKDCTGGKPADIYFLLDASSSVYVLDFKDRVLPFVKDLVKAFKISPRDTRVGVVTFSTDVNHSFGLSDHTDKNSLLAAIDPKTVQYLTGDTRTGEAIAYVTDQLAHAQRSATRVVITVTDGQSQQPKKTAESAELARQQGVYMFSVGVGQYVDHQELKNIASDPDEDFVFSVEDFGGLDSISGLLASKTCEVVQRTTLPPTSSTTRVTAPPTTHTKEKSTTKATKSSTFKPTESPSTTTLPDETTFAGIDLA